MIFADGDRAEGILVVEYSPFSAVKPVCRNYSGYAFRLGQIVALVAIFAVGIGPGWASPATADYISLTEITPGMTGYGLTVFQGSRVDTFGVTVIGVQEKVRAAGSLLLIEVSGHGLETSGIAQGMSGSPIYLEGRFAGALAFGWGGSLRPVAGVTPAAEMLALPTNIPVTSPPARGEAGAELSDLVPLNSDTPTLATDIWANGVKAPPVPGQRRLATGWPDAPRMWLELLAPLAARFPELDTGPDQWLFQPLGLGADAAGRSRSAGSERLVPGAACAVPLVIGDASLGAIGTVTWVDGNQVLLMGHPFMQRGPVNLPLATANVLTILPSRQMSFKMGSVGSIIGAVHHDLRAGLSGRLGAAPPMIPVRVSVARGQTGDVAYNFAVVDDPLLTPTLVFWSIYNAVLVRGDDASLQTMRYRVETTWSGPAILSDSPLVISGVSTGPGGAASLASDVMTPLNILLNNPHAVVRLDSVHAVLEQTRSLQTARIIGLTSPRSLLRAGEKVVFKAAIEPRQGQSESIDFPVTIPARLPPGPYRVVVASAAELFALESQRAAGRFQPESLGGILAILRTGRARDTLVLALFAPGKATILQGQELRNLPPSVARTVRAGNLQAQRSLADYVWRVEQPSAWALTGHAVRSLQIQPAMKTFPEERRP